MSEPNKEPTSPTPNAVQPVAQKLPRPRGWRKWLYRLAAMTFVPMMFFGSLECGLRAVNYGHDTRFFIDGSKLERRGVWIDNREFGRWVFPQGMENTPAPIPFVMGEKSPGTTRIFILGESAAMGFPEPAFNFGRIIEVMLKARYPESRFEIINVAMTAINSHTVLSIARECMDHKPDLLIVHLGNNEVVGPYGAAGVLGPFSPSRTIIRTNLAIRKTRTGQLFHSLINRPSSTDTENHTWKGMAMFAESTVRFDDPRLARINDHFRRNLSDICSLGTGANIPVLVCTIPSNLRASAPFASLHSSTLDEGPQTTWAKLYDEGVQFQNANRYVEAIASFRAAERIDNKFADLAYRLGQCLEGLGRFEESRELFTQARDLDALRFRSDSNINQTIRDVVRERASQGIHLIDAERAFEQSSAPKSPGEDFFLEHVHMNFSGNYLLALTTVRSMTPLLDSKLANIGNATTPSQQQCADMLGYTLWSERKSMRRILLEKFPGPPFTHQLDRGQRETRWQTRLQAIDRQLDEKNILQIASVLRVAVESNPRDWMLRNLYGLFLTEIGNFPLAAEQFDTVLQSFRHNAESHYFLAQTLLSMGDAAAAESHFRQVLRLAPDPNNIPCYTGLADALGAQNKVDEGLKIHEDLLSRSKDRARSLRDLVAFLMLVGRVQEAKTRLNELMQINPNDPAAQARLGDIALLEGSKEEALRYYEAALKTRPDWPELKAQVARVRAGEDVKLPKEQKKN